MKRKVFFIVGLILLLAVSGGIFGQATALPNPGPKAKYFFYFSQRGQNVPWCASMTESFARVAEKNKNRISKYVWTDGANDAAKQLSDIEDVLKMKPDVLFLTPQEYEADAVVADHARKAGTVLFVIDRRINAIPGKDYAVWIGGDYRAQGRVAAEELMAKIFSDKGEYKANIVEIAGTAGSSPQIDRGDGFRDIIGKYPKVKIVATQDGDFTRDNALRIMENYLQRYPKGQIDAVYTHNDEMGIGAVEAIERAGRTELFNRIVSVDGQKEALKLIIDGKMLATAQCPAGYGEISIDNALKYLDGKKVPTEIQIPFEHFSNRTKDLLDRTKEYYQFQLDHNLTY